MTPRRSPAKMRGFVSPHAEQDRLTRLRLGDSETFRMAYYVDDKDEFLFGHTEIGAANLVRFCKRVSAECPKFRIVQLYSVRYR